MDRDEKLEKRSVFFPFFFWRACAFVCLYSLFFKRIWDSPNEIFFLFNFLILVRIDIYIYIGINCARLFYIPRGRSFFFFSFFSLPMLLYVTRFFKYSPAYLSSLFLFLCFKCPRGMILSLGRSLSIIIVITIIIVIILLLRFCVVVFFQCFAASSCSGCELRRASEEELRGGLAKALWRRSIVFKRYY